MPPTDTHRVLDFARTRGVVRARDLEPLGIARSVLTGLVAQGRLLRLDRGLYMSPEADITEHHSLVEVAARIGGATVNLLSALAFHELTDELPHAVWVAMPRGSQVPRFSSPRLEITWSPAALRHLGVDRHTIEGIEVAITNPARTVADCFKFRSRIGIDIAIAALRDYVARYHAGRDALWEMAGACRVQSVIRPYLESLS
jgi:predicted transcriptional regulator of viral defense system